MFVLIVLLVAAVIGLIVLAVLGYGLVGHIRRFQRALASARIDLEPQLAALRPPDGDSGRHRNTD